MTASFQSLNLLPSILKAIQNEGYDIPTPIQLQAIPPLLEGRDLLGIAQTGTGKTAAFALPILHFLGTHTKRPPKGRSRVLILTPTRELATQINDSIKKYSVGMKIATKVIFGGVGHRPQVQAISQGLDIIVATPGRLLEHIEDGVVTFSDLDILVLDEADRMLDMGFIRDINKILKVLPEKKQTLLFSATMPNDIGSLAKSLLKNPVKIEVTPESTTVEKIQQTVIKVPKSNKTLLLMAILQDKSIRSVLVFTRTKHGADRVVRHLSKTNISAAAIHGNKSQNARETALGDFRQGKVRVLVATDIAARGIDIDHVGYVINFDLPEDAESYVHRIGRTGRAGRSGQAISFCDDAELKLLKAIEKLIKIKIPAGKKYNINQPAPKKANAPANNQKKKQIKNKVKKKYGKKKKSL